MLIENIKIVTKIIDATCDRFDQKRAVHSFNMFICYFNNDFCYTYVLSLSEILLRFVNKLKHEYCYSTSIRAFKYP